MGLSAEKAQNKQADTLLGSTTKAVDKASEVNPATKEMEDYWKSIIDWDTGKSGPVDVHNLPGSGVDIGLFESAKKNSDAGRIGRGFGTMGDNTNPAFTEALGKEMESDRATAASGMLEDAVQGKVAEARGALTGIGAQETQQSLNAAGLRANLYSTYLNRPRNPGLLSQFIGGATGAAGTLGASAIANGGWAGLFAM